jgi:asparagine synthase (glutamine-hydrolysing)
LARHKELTLNAVTIGGKEINEIPEAKICAEQYDNVKHIGWLIGENRLDSFPDIVWKNEGYVFERGLFLAYELAKKLEKNKTNCIFGGDCADQMLDQYRHSKIQKLKGEIKNLFRGSVIGDIFYVFVKKESPEKSKTGRILKQFKKHLPHVRYDLVFDYILKKNGLMLNAAGVQVLYPFLNKETKVISKALGKLNSGKQFYKTEVKKFLGREKSKHIQKVGGSTDIEFLFENRQDLIQKLLESKFTSRILCRKDIAKIAKNPKYYHLLILQLLFVYLFNELFVSGKYDSFFGSQRLEMPLNEFI